MTTYTPVQLAKALQVSRGKVMTWIKSGKLGALNMSDGAVPRYRITQYAVDEFLDSRRVKAAPMVRPNRRITARTAKDYFADLP